MVTEAEEFLVNQQSQGRSWNEHHRTSKEVSTRNEDFWRLVSVGGENETEDDSPILVDTLGLGYPDLLAGPEWNVPRLPFASEKVYRKFNLDLKGEKWWEWVGGKTPLLVYGESGEAPVEVTGAELFGNYSFGRRWAHGYEALAVLDVDLSGWVEGREMGELFLWYDRNADAKVEPGEMVPASSEVRRLSVKPEYQAGKKSPYSSAERLDGVTIRTWDWISAQGAGAEAGYWGVQVAPGGGGEPPLMYRWTTLEGWEIDPTHGSGGAVFRWFFVGKDLYLYSSASGVNAGSQNYSKVKVTPKGDSYELSWQWLGSNQPNYATLLSDGLLLGRSPGLMPRRNGGSLRPVNPPSHGGLGFSEGRPYWEWQARFVPSSSGYAGSEVYPQLLSLAAASDQALVEALGRTDMLDNGRVVFPWAVKEPSKGFERQKNLYEELKARGF
jgi:hypothetical protein